MEQQIISKLKVDFGCLLADFFPKSPEMNRELNAALLKKVEFVLLEEGVLDFNKPTVAITDAALRQCNVKRSLPKMKCSCDLQLKFCKTPSLCVSDILGNDA